MKAEIPSALPSVAYGFFLPKSYPQSYRSCTESPFQRAGQRAHNIPMLKPLRS